MNYYGGPIPHHNTTNETPPSSEATPLASEQSLQYINTAYDFLKHALLTGTKTTDIIPARGPAQFKMPNDPQFDGWAYTNTITGTMDSFHGTEEITHNGTPICQHTYHGGSIK